jgi:ketosteroid isomerase-like protein
MPTTDLDQAIAELQNAMERGDLAAATELTERYAAPDFTVEWPQSGERIRGIDNHRKLNEQYASATGSSPTIKQRRVLHDGNLIVSEGTVDYGDGIPVSTISIFEFRDGKVFRATEYFANPFEAPAWRAPFVETM